MRTTKHLCRRIINGFLLRLGYTVDGNHVFTLADYDAIFAGNWRAAVSEKPARHPAQVVRAAELLAKTYA